MSLLPDNAASVLLVTKSWPEVRAYLSTSDLIVFPTGSVEQHGPTCPLMTDTLIAEYLACRVGLREGVLVGPSISLGDSLLQLAFPGTIALRPSTLFLVLKDYIASLYHHGFRRFLVVNGHADNHGVIQAAFSEIGHDLDDVRYYLNDFWDFAPFREIMRRAFSDDVGGHADATDAAILLEIAKDFVNPEGFTKGTNKVKYWISRNLVPQLYGTSGVMNGDQRMATRGVGAELVEVAVECYSQLLRDLRG